jgi:hypothetical protein
MQLENRKLLKSEGRVHWSFLGSSVADPDPRVFGPPGFGSGSISQR